MAIHKLKIFSCRSSRYLAEKIAANFGVNLGNSQVLEFSDGEFQPAYDESIRGCTVFIVQSTFPPADNLMESAVDDRCGPPCVGSPGDCRHALFRMGPSGP